MIINYPEPDKSAKLPGKDNIVEMAPSSPDQVDTKIRSLENGCNELKVKFDKCHTSPEKSNEHYKEANYSALKSEYDCLQLRRKDLTHEYDHLKWKYNTLERQYERQTYEYDSLRFQYKLTRSELDVKEKEWDKKIKNTRISALKRIVAPKNTK